MSCLSNINAKTDIENVMDMFKSLNDGMVTRAIAMEAAVILMGVPSTAAAGAAAASAAESVFTSVSLAAMEAKRIEIMAAEAFKGPQCSNRASR